MMTKTQVDEVLQAFCEGLGIDKCRLNDELVCPLTFGTDTAVLLLFDNAKNRLALATEIAELLPDEDPEFLRRLLAANVLGRESRGATFAVDPETRLVVLQTKIDGGDLDVDRFSAYLERHLDVADAWMNALAGIVSDDESEDDRSGSVNDTGPDRPVPGSFV